ncbi:hypothetical protein CERZMDRAFT_82064 [Cercospora zeae-maydis SCOH1-5]|uniref:Uncharacterized protein n=1 Tax=Cercospora zeae-maydis SCOH1-5 TaxID=717836 RepID=A0A6A6FR97_9PEZI|nr:hypothetical protein CERZMDRAFT_82064 [Cercospora zeae-maydis SCOH1-5]
MLLGRPTRVGLSHADIKEYQIRSEARRPSHQTRFSIAGVRVSSIPSHITRVSITRAHNNLGRVRADSCSSEATICSADQPDIPSLDPGAPILVSQLPASSSAEGNIDRYPPFQRPALPQRTSSRRHHTSFDHGTWPRDDVWEQCSHRSSPNLLVTRSPPSPHPPRIRTRSSSLTWERTQENKSQSRNVVTGASGSSRRASKSTTFPLDLLHRESPLDELSHHLSRLATGSYRPRSVGRSFERRPGQRILLLSGDPFNVRSETDMPNPSTEPVSPLLPEPADDIKNRRDSVVDPQDLYELSLALPSPQMQTLPSTYHSKLRRAMSPTRNVVSSSSTPSSTPRGPLRVTVYDDSLPMALQPQTPADLVRSTARRYRHSPSASRRIQAEVATSPLSGVPDRASNRQTYPMSNPSQRTSASDTPMRPPTALPARHTLFVDRSSSPMQSRQSPTYQSSTPVRPPQHAVAWHHDYTAQQELLLRQTLRHDRIGSGENDIAVTLDTVEQDRHTWVARREQHGELDLTPPAEGRFERHFS